METSDVTLRSAVPHDAPAVAAVWHAGWQDGHLGHVPDELVALRTEASFYERAAANVRRTTVAVRDGEIAGFVMVSSDEVEQVYVAARHRGSGVSSTLLAAAEAQVRDHGHPTAWLAVAPGNARARRFYERSGWRDSGPLDYVADGVTVPVRRYVREV